jgi:hypothetical protein
MANPLPPGLPPGFWDDYRERYETEIEALRKELAPLQSGDLRLRSGGTDGIMRDVTEHWITHLRHTIKNYQAMVDAVKRGELP